MGQHTVLPPDRFKSFLKTSFTLLTFVSLHVLPDNYQFHPIQIPQLVLIKLLQ